MIKDIQENYGNGWIKAYRSIKKHWIWKDDKYLKMWIDFLFRANHQENKILLDSTIIPVFRGTFITSLKKLSKEYNCSIGKIRHFLELLEKDEMIVPFTTHKYTQITICNYSNYQDKEHAERKGNETGMKSERHGNETNKNVKNDKKLKKKEGAVRKIGNRELVISEYFLDQLPIEADQKFIESWVEWVDYRKEIKKKLTKASVKKQLKLLLEQPEPSICIDQSIRNQWTGLFEDKSNGKDNNQSKGTVQSRVDYKFDPEKAAKRLEELEDTFGSRN